MGFRTVALSRGIDKKDFAMRLGATDYIDIQAHDIATELQKLGGAALAVVTDRTQTLSARSLVDLHRKANYSSILRLDRYQSTQCRLSRTRSPYVVGRAGTRWILRKQLRSRRCME